MAEKKSTDTKQPAFTKAQLLASDKYRGKRDVLSALLADDKSYTSTEVDAVIEKYMKGKVK